VKKLGMRAYAEYARSRALYPTKSATKNAAISLRNLRRYDEALDMYETLLRDFPALSEQDRAFAQAEIARLQRFVGTVELRGVAAGASITVTQDRGTMPLQRAPLHDGSIEKLAAVLGPRSMPRQTIR
jgi:hypothetical protein